MCRWMRTCTPMRIMSSTAHCCSAGRGPPRVVLRQAQDDRHERPSRGHPRRTAGVDLRPHRWQPARQPLPDRGSRAHRYGRRKMAGRQWLCRQQHDHANQEATLCDLLDWEKEFNTQINKIRWIIEQVIANLKTWRILHTDYRRPINTFSTTISAVIALHFWSYA